MDKLVMKEYRGCGACELCNKNIDCKKMQVPVKIKFKKSQRADNWGETVTVFEKGETVSGKAVIKDNVVCCISAKSSIYKGYEDFIDFKDIEIKKI